MQGPVGDGGRGGPPEALGKILERVMRGARPRRRRNAVADAWRDAGGADLAETTRPATLRQGVLMVEVRSAALLHELAGFRKEDLLARLLAADSSGRVTGLEFRLGVF